MILFFYILDIKWSIIQVYYLEIMILMISVIFYPIFFMITLNLRYNWLTSKYFFLRIWSFSINILHILLTSIPRKTQTKTTIHPYIIPTPWSWTIKSTKSHIIACWVIILINIDPIITIFYICFNEFIESGF